VALLVDHGGRERQVSAGWAQLRLECGEVRKRKRTLKWMSSEKLTPPNGAPTSLLEFCLGYSSLKTMGQDLWDALTERRTALPQLMGGFRRAKGKRSLLYFFGQRERAWAAYLKRLTFGASQRRLRTLVFVLGSWNGSPPPGFRRPPMKLLRAKLRCIVDLLILHEARTSKLCSACGRKGVATELKASNLADNETRPGMKGRRNHRLRWCDLCQICWQRDWNACWAIRFIYLYMVNHGFRRPPVYRSVYAWCRSMGNGG